MSDPDKSHSRIVGGSSAERVLHCNGSIRLVNETIAKSSSFADEGTALHLATEWLLRQNESPQAALGRTFHGHVITEEHLARCLVPAIAAFDRIVGPKPFELEVSAPLPGIAGAFGTSDVVYFDDLGTFIGILDWKFGEGHRVSAAGNGQMMFYLYSQMQRQDIGRVMPKLKATIVQPRLNHEETAEYAWKELTRFAFQLSAAVTAPETFHKGPWCHWCPGKPRCPEHWGKKAARLTRFLDRQKSRG